MVRKKLPPGLHHLAWLLESTWNGNVNKLYAPLLFIHLILLLLFIHQDSRDKEVIQRKNPSAVQMDEGAGQGQDPECSREFEVPEPGVRMEDVLQGEASVHHMSIPPM